jgi:hypothetical protein
VVGRAQRVAHAARQRLELLQVLPGAEALAGAGENDGAHLPVARLLERGGERLVQVTVEGVVDLRPVEADGQDSAFAGGQHLAHAREIR